MVLWDELSEPLGNAIAFGSAESDLPGALPAITELMGKCLVACTMVDISGRLPSDLNRREHPLLGAYETLKLLLDTRKLSAVEADIVRRASDHLRHDPYLRHRKLSQLGGGYEAADARKAAVEAAKARAEADFDRDQRTRDWLRRFPVGAAVRFRYGTQWLDGKDDRLNMKFYPWFQGRVEGVSEDGRSLLIRETHRSLWARIASGPIAQVVPDNHVIERIG